MPTIVLREAHTILLDLTEVPHEKRAALIRAIAATIRAAGVDARAGLNVALSELIELPADPSEEPT